MASIPDPQPQGEDPQRLPDLGRSDDLNQPINRLRGIDNYCNVLMESYEESARRWWDEQDQASKCYELVLKGGEFAPMAEGQRDECLKRARQYECVCEDWHKRLCELSEAMRLAMRDRLVACKVVKLYPTPLHRDRSTDWGAFVVELKCIQLDARGLLDELTGIGGTANDAKQSNVASRQSEGDIPPGSYETYRSMLEHPAIRRAHKRLVSRIASATWSVDGSEQLSKPLPASVRRCLDCLARLLVDGGVTILDFGWSSFEIVYKYSEGYIVIEQLKWLDPTLTKILQDEHGSFAGIENAGVRLEPKKSLLLSLRAPGDRAEVSYGRSQLENVREAWGRWKSGVESGDIDQRLYLGYFGGSADPGAIDVEVREVLDVCRVALDKLTNFLLNYNVGSEAIDLLKWRYSLPLVSNEHNQSPRTEKASRLAYLCQELEARFREHRERTAPALAPLITETTGLAMALGYHVPPIVVENAGDINDALVMYRLNDPLTGESIYALTYRTVRQGDNAGGTWVEGVAKEDDAEVRKWFDRWQRDLAHKYGFAVAKLSTHISARVLTPTTNAADDAESSSHTETTDPDAGLAPSRMKAKAAYDWAIGNILGAEKMTIAEMFTAIEDHPSQANEMLPPNAEAFGKYLRDAGVKRYDKTGKRRSARSVRRSDQI